MPYPPPERQPLRPVRGWGVRVASLGALAIALGAVGYFAYRPEAAPAGRSLESGEASAPRPAVADGEAGEAADAALVAPAPYVIALRALGCDRATVLDLGAARDPLAPSPPSSAATAPDLMVACEIPTEATRPGCDEVSAAYVASGSVPRGAAGYVVMVAAAGAAHPSCHARYLADGGAP